MSEAAATPLRAAYPRASLYCAAVILGFAGIVAQVVLTRELLGLFLGSELSIALVLSVWLVAVAIGGAAGTLLKSAALTATRAVVWVQVATGIALPAAVLVARTVSFGGLDSGQAPGIPTILSVSLLALAPPCLLIGVQFVSLCRALPADGDSGQDASLAQVGRVYALEAVGAIGGGLAFHFHIAEHVGALQTMILLGAVNWLGAAAVLWAVGKRAAKCATFLVGFSAVVVGSAVMGEAGRGCEMAALQFSPRWRHASLLQEAPSKYGDLIVSEHDGEIAVHQSGVLLFTSQDHESNEALAHMALLQHPHPRHVLLIGGGAAGVAGEILKHRIRRLDYVELDPRILAVARTWLPRELTAPLSDPRAHVDLGDGRLFVKNTDLRFDVVVVALPDPTTAVLNRFYTQEFFSEVARAMNPGAVLLTALTSSEVHVGGAMRLATASIHASLRAVFAEALIVPGERLLLLASNRRGVLSSDWTLLANRLRGRKLHCHVVTPYWLRENLIPFRREMIVASIREERAARPNRDLSPVAYHYQMSLWLEQTSPGLDRALQHLRALSLWWFALPILAALVWALAAPKRWARPVAAIGGIAAMGAFGLAGEFVALLVFQAARGYLYHQLGILFALFMGGLAAGSFWAAKRCAGAESWGARWLPLSLGASAALAAALGAIAVACLRWEALAMPVVGIFLLTAGFVDGSAFPAAVGVYASRSSPPRAGGLIYAADLAGSALGALLAACILVPVLGLSGASVALALGMVAAALLTVPLGRRT